MCLFLCYKYAGFHENREAITSPRVRYLIADNCELPDMSGKNQKEMLSGSSKCS